VSQALDEIKIGGGRQPQAVEDAASHELRGIAMLCAIVGSKNEKRGGHRDGTEHVADASRGKFHYRRDAVHREARTLNELVRSERRRCIIPATFSRTGAMAIGIATKCKITPTS